MATCVAAPTVYPVVGKAVKGDVLPLVGRSKDGAWFEVQLKNGKPAWIAASLVLLNVANLNSVPLEQTIPPTPKPAPTKPAAPPRPSYPTGTIVGRVVDAHGEARVGESLGHDHSSKKHPGCSEKDGLQ